MRRLLIILFFAVLIAFLAKPTKAYSEVRRLWSQRDWVMKVLATAVTIYFIYGLYSLWVFQGS